MRRYRLSWEQPKRFGPHTESGYYGIGWSTEAKDFTAKNDIEAKQIVNNILSNGSVFSPEGNIEWKRKFKLLVHISKNGKTRKIH